MTDRQTDNTQNKSENLQEKLILVIAPKDSDKRDTSFSLYTRCYSLNVTLLLFFLLNTSMKSIKMKEKIHP